MTPDLALRLKAGAIGAHASDTLSVDATGVVHAVFEKVLYIEIANRLACITRPGVEMGPLNIALDDDAPDWPAMGLRPGQKVRRLDRGLHVSGRITVDLAPASPWRPPHHPALTPATALATLHAADPCPPDEGLGKTILTGEASEDAMNWLTGGSSCTAWECC